MAYDITKKENDMKYGLSWDRYRQQLTASKPWALLFGFETLVFVVMIIVNLVSEFFG